MNQTDEARIADLEAKVADLEETVLTLSAMVTRILEHLDPSGASRTLSPLQSEENAYANSSEDV